MQMSGMPGEQHYGDDSVWITKTHYPFATDKPYQHKVDKIIYLARNPGEILPSYASLFTTGSHSLEPERPWNEYEEFWKYFVDKHTICMAKFFETIVQQA